MINEILNDSRLLFIFTFSTLWIITLLIGYIFLIKPENKD